MSYYYNYYLGIKTSDNQIKPLGIFAADGSMYPVLCRSRSFASDLHDFFDPVKEEMITDELRRQFEYDDCNGEKKMDKIKFLSLDALPSGSYIKSGYYLLEDIQRYEKTHDSEDLFYDSLTPQEYIIRSDNEIKFGKPGKRIDDFGEEYLPHSASDYGYYMYPDYLCKEYEANVIRIVAEAYEYGTIYLNHGEIVVLETEG